MRTPDEECPDNLLPDGETCPRCGGPRAPSGIDGGSWVHFPRRPKMQPPDAAPAPAPSETDVEALLRNAISSANALRLAVHSATGSRATIHPARAGQAADVLDRLAAALHHERDQRTALEEAHDRAYDMLGLHISMPGGPSLAAIYAVLNTPDAVERQKARQLRQCAARRSDA